MSSNINGVGGPGNIYNSGDKSVKPRSTPSSSFGQYMVEGDEEDLTPQSQESAEEASNKEESFGGFSPFGSYGSFGNNRDNDNDNSSDSFGQSRNASSRSSNKPEVEDHHPAQKQKQKIAQKGKHHDGVGEDKIDKDDKPQSKLKEITPDNPLAAFQVPQQVERAFAPMPVEKTGPKLEPEVIDQIVQDVRLGVNAQGAAEFQFDLKSDVMDGLKLKISTKEGKVSATFIAENVHVKDAIDQSTQELIQALRDRGLEVANIQVSVGSDSAGSGQQQQQQSGNQQHSDHQQQSQSDYDFSNSGSSNNSRAANNANTSRSNTDYTI